MNRHHLFNILLISIISFAVSWQLFLPGYFSMHDDLQIMRLYEMDRCFKDGQIPCRWVPDMGAGYGQPMFNFYSAFPYYLGEIIKLTGFTFIATAKILVLLCVLASGLLSYFFLNQIFTRSASLLGAIAYLFIPYRALDLFVRGALSESWALALLPGVLGAIILLIKKPKVSNVILLSLLTTAFLTTHNVTTLTSSIFIVIITLLNLKKHGITREKLGFLFLSGILGIGLSAFFLLPVLLEKGLSQTEYLISDYYRYENHFLAIKQIFTPTPWGFGSPNIGPGNILSFFIGFVPLISLMLVPVILLIEKDSKKRLEYFIYLGLGLFSLFMVHSRSFYIWRAIPSLAYAQFPWRFLGIFALFASMFVSIISERFEKHKLVIFIIGVSIILSTFNLFKFGKHYPNLTDEIKLTGSEYEQQARAALLDYLPQASKKIPNALAPTTPTILEGRVSTNYYENRSNYFGSEFDIYTPTAKIQIPVVYFPGWKVHLNRSGNQAQYSIDNDYGLITLELKAGHQLVQGFFEDTPIRRAANTITMLSAVALVLLVKYQKTQNEK